MNDNIERRAVRTLLGDAIALRSVERLHAYGLIDRTRAEQYMLWREVARMTARGHGRCRAMAEVGLRMACSYEKVRRAVYAVDKIIRENE